MREISIIPSVNPAHLPAVLDVFGSLRASPETYARLADAILRGDAESALGIAGRLGRFACSLIPRLPIAGPESGEHAPFCGNCAH